MTDNLQTLGLYSDPRTVPYMLIPLFHKSHYAICYIITSVNQSAISSLFLVHPNLDFQPARHCGGVMTGRKTVLPRHKIGTKPFKADGLERAIGFDRANSIIELLGEIAVLLP